MTERDRQDKWVHVVTQLNKLTQEGALKWEPIYPPATLKDQNYVLVDPVFRTIYKDKVLVAFSREWEGYGVETGLAFLSEEDKLLWRFPEISGTSDLLESIRFQVADVQGFLDELLK